MNAANYSKWKNVLLIVAVLMLIVEIPGALRTYNWTYWGARTDGNHTIVEVSPKSPAAAAGLRVGDYILKFNGINVDDTRALARLPRIKIGDERTYTIRRNGEILDIPVTFSRMPFHKIVLGFTATFIGFCIIIFCMIPYFKIQTKNTLLLAIAGLGLGFSYLDMPTFSSLTLRIIRATIWTIIVFWGLASMLHFMLSFPKPKKFLSKKVMMILYAIPAFIFVYYLSFNLVLPNSTHLLRSISRILYSGLIATYALLSMIALFHSYMVASGEKRKEQKLHCAFWAFVIGIVPILIMEIFTVFLPNVILPFSEYYFLSVIIIPIALSYSVLHTEGAGKTISA